MAFTARVGSLMGMPVQRIVGVGLVCLLAAALLGACANEPAETPTAQAIPATSTPELAQVPPIASAPLVPAPTTPPGQANAGAISSNPVPPTAGPVSTPTAPPEQATVAPLIPDPVAPPSVTVPTPSPAPAATPSPAPAATPEQASNGAIPIFAINRDSTWRDLFDAFSADEQSCIRNVLGDEQLELVLSQRLMSEAASEQLDARLQDCLAPETAAGIILSVFIGQMEGLSRGGRSLYARVDSGCGRGGHR